MSDLPFQDDDRDALESLLRWYVAMGVDAPVDEAPHDRFVAAAEPLPVQQVTRKAPMEPPTGLTPRVALDVPLAAEAQIREANVRAAAAPDLEGLRATLQNLPGLALATSARMIFSGGTPGARLMLVAGAPESDDERQGEAFAGAHGRLLDAMLRAIGLARTDVYIAHLVPWRPPGNRAPTPLELGLCLPFLRRHIALARPDILLCLGERAAQPLLGTRDPISRLRGRWLAYEGERAATKLLATFSPTYLLGQPLQKRRAWTDLQMLADTLSTQRRPNE